MSITPNPGQTNIGAIVAGTSQAAAKGGESDNRAAEAQRQVNTAESPGGKQVGVDKLEAGDETTDRDANGQQVYDTFERSSDETQEQPSDPEAKSPRGSTHTGQLDLEA